MQDTQDKKRNVEQQKKVQPKTTERQIEFAKLKGRFEGICQLLSKDMYLHYDSVEEICEIAKTYIENNQDDVEEIEAIQNYFLKVETLLKYNIEKRSQNSDDGKLSNSVGANPYEKMVKKFQ